MEHIDKYSQALSKKIEIYFYRLISKSPLGSFCRYLSKPNPRIILAYHGVEPNHPFCIEPDMFRDQILFLKENYNIVPLDDIFQDNVGEENPLVSLTFDDAYSNLLEYALPILSKRNVPAIIYAPVNHLGGTNEWDSSYKYTPLMKIMSKQELSTIYHQGFHIGSHTLNHIRLRNRDEATLKNEIADSKRALEDIIGGPVVSFAYPHGGIRDMDDNADNAIREAGYTSAVTTHFGRFNDWENRFKLRRIIMWPTDSLDVLRLKLAGNFDWLAPKEDMIYLIRSTLGK